MKKLSQKARRKVESYFSFVAALLFCLLTTCGCSSSEPTPKAEVQAQLRSKLQLTQFNRIAGTNYLRAGAYLSDNADGLEGILKVSSYGESNEYRNQLFVNLDDFSSRWLLPNNDVIFLTTLELPFQNNGGARTGNQSTTSGEPVTKWVYYEIIKSDSNKDGRMNQKDQKSIAISDPSGDQYGELINDIDGFWSRTMVGDENLSLVYRSKEKFVAVEINLPQRKITKSKELPGFP
jgi:hypothetical protein